MDLTAFPGAAYADWVLPFLDEAMTKGQRVALATLVGVTGSSPRPLGSQLAVREDGASIGLISGGCVEPSLVLDAVAAIKQGRSYMERYGEGSRFIDIRLPCGSGIDVWFDTGLTLDIVRALIEGRAQRRPVTLAIDTVRGGSWLMTNDLAADEKADGLFLRRYVPPCRIMIAGAGHVMLALAQLCRLSEFEIELISTDRLTCQMLEHHGFGAREVNAWGQFDWQQLDRWSGAVLLSHDHDDEVEILASVLDTQAFYVGALGSRRTHERRCELLRHIGVSEKALTRVNGPIGLDIGAMTLPEIATSILAEIIASWRALPSQPAIGAMSPDAKSHARQQRPLSLVRSAGR
jgi:xanthine dehydrogenase accessory factor